MRILERGTPGGNDGAHAVPHHPDLPVTLEKKFVIDQAAVDDASDHFPVADDHPYVSVLFAALRVLLHHLFRRIGMEGFGEPCPCLTQAGLTPDVIQAQHQVYFLVGDLGHAASSWLSRGVRLRRFLERMRNAGEFDALQGRNGYALFLKLDLNATPQLSGHFILARGRGPHLYPYRGSNTIKILES